MTKSIESMFNESVNTIFHYQVGETFTEPKKEDIDILMKEIEKKNYCQAISKPRKCLARFAIKLTSFFTSIILLQ